MIGITMGVSAAVIPVAGLGTRLLPLTKGVPKELLPLGRKPVLQHVVEEMQAAGAHNLVMITSESKSSIREHFSVDASLEQQLLEQGKNELLNDMQFLSEQTRLIYVNQKQQKGLGDAVLCARESIGDQNFLIALGDARLGDTIMGDARTGDARTSDAMPAEAETSTSAAQNNASLCRRMIECFERSDADFAIAFQQVSAEKVSRYGIAEPAASVKPNDEFFSLNSIVEKPSPQDAPSHFAVAARYVCKPVIFDYLARTSTGIGGEIQLTDAIQALIADGGKVIGVPLQGQEKRYDVGNYESYFTAFIEMALNDPQCGEVVRNNVQAMLRKMAEEE